MTINTTTLTYYSPIRHTKIFCKYIADNGKSLCTIDNCIVTKEEGNQKFLDLVKNFKNHKVEKKVVEANNEEILKNLDSHIDHYVEYIDDYKRYSMVRASNNEIYAVIDAFKEVAKGV